MEIFFPINSTFLQQVAPASLQKASMAFYATGRRDPPLIHLAVEQVSFLCFCFEMEIFL